MAVMDKTGSWKEDGDTEDVGAPNNKEFGGQLAASFVDLHQSCNLQWPKEHG